MLLCQAVALENIKDIWGATLRNEVPTVGLSSAFVPQSAAVLLGLAIPSNCCVPAHRGLAQVDRLGSHEYKNPPRRLITTLSHSRLDPGVPIFIPKA